MEIRFLLQGSDLICGNSVREIKVAGVVSCQDSGIIRGKHQVDLGDGNFVSSVVVVILDQNDGLFMLPFLHGVSAVGNEACFRCPCAGVGLPAFRCFYLCLRNGQICGECRKVKEVSAGSDQVDRQGLAVFGSGNIQRTVIGCGDGIEHVAIVSGRLGSGSPLPGIFEILCGQICAVGPFQTVTQCEGIGQAVFGYFGILSQCGLQVAVGVISVKAFEHIDCQAGAVNRRVQRGIDLGGLGSQIDLENVSGAGRELEVFEAEQVGVNTFHIGLLQIQIIIVVDRNNSRGAHQDIFCLVHQSDTVFHICGGLDLFDQSFILGPVGSGFTFRDGGIGNAFGSRINGGLDRFTSLTGVFRGGCCGRISCRGRRSTASAAAGSQQGRSSRN